MEYLLELCGYEVKLIPGDKMNVKLTFPEDLNIVELFIQNDKEMRDLMRSKYI